MRRFNARKSFAVLALTAIAAAFLAPGAVVAQSPPPLDSNDIVRANPCSSIAGDYVPATSFPMSAACDVIQNPKGLHINLTAKAGPYTFHLPPGPKLNGLATDSEGRVVAGADGRVALTVNDLMLYNGLFAPQVMRVDAGDVLKIDLTNELAKGPYQATNVHTHGLLVSPDLDTKPNPNNPGETIAAEPVGDTVYVCTEPQNREALSDDPCAHHGAYFGGDHTKMSYELPLPKSHPDGLYWYHPHVHGNARTQVGSGLSGLIYIKGQTADGYSGGGVKLPAVDPATGKPPAPPVERFLMLKDLQIKYDPAPAGPGWTFLPVKDDAHSANLCGGVNAGALSSGYCATPDGGMAWLFTVNGEIFPTYNLAPGEKQIWRIANVSADMTYDLALVEQSSGRPLRLQILARDGVAAIAEPGQDPTIMAERILLMPGSRIEVGVDRASAEGVFDEGNALEASLRSYGFYTGGDAWPAVDLANVVFAANPSAGAAPAVTAAAKTPAARRTLSAKSPADAAKKFEPLVVMPWKQNPAAAKTIAPSRAAMKGTMPAAHNMAMQMHGGAVNEHPQPEPAKGECDFLGKNEDRVIALAISKPASGGEFFKIGADRAPSRDKKKMHEAVEEAIEHARQFGVGKPLVLCAHAGHSEYWTIANKVFADNSETHNFHIHQMKFEVVDVFDPNGRIGRPRGGAKAKRKVDSYPVPIGGYLRIRIDFTKQMTGGRFVFHCHILEHEDKGMMAQIEVKPR